MTNEEKQEAIDGMFEYVKAAQLSIDFVAKYIFNTNSSALYSWKKNPRYLTDEKAMQVTDLRDTLRYLVENRQLPLDKDRLIFEGLCHLTDNL